jgi:hypothetical protein
MGLPRCQSFSSPLNRPENQQVVLLALLPTHIFLILIPAGLDHDRLDVDRAEVVEVVLLGSTATVLENLV